MLTERCPGCLTGLLRDEPERVVCVICSREWFRPEISAREMVIGRAMARAMTRWSMSETT